MSLRFNETSRCPPPPPASEKKSATPMGSNAPSQCPPGSLPLQKILPVEIPRQEPGPVKAMPDAPSQCPPVSLPLQDFLRVEIPRQELVPVKAMPMGSDAPSQCSSLAEQKLQKLRELIDEWEETPMGSNAPSQCPPVSLPSQDFLRVEIPRQELVPVKAMPMGSDAPSQCPPSSLAEQKLQKLRELIDEWEATKKKKENAAMLLAPSKCHPVPLPLQKFAQVMIPRRERLPIKANMLHDGSTFMRCSEADLDIRLLKWILGPRMLKWISLYSAVCLLLFPVIAVCAVWILQFIVIHTDEMFSL